MKSTSISSRLCCTYLKVKIAEIGLEVTENDLEQATRRCADGEIQRDLRDISWALRAESHWIRSGPCDLAGLLNNRLVNRGWPRDKLPNVASGGSLQVRLRHALQRRDLAERTLMGHKAAVRAWGSGPDDIWFLCKGRLVLHWNGTGCASYQLPGDEDDEYCAIGGSGPQDPIWVVGVGGIMACGDGEGWEVIESGTEATLLGVSVAGPDDVWVTANGGQLRHYDGIGWTTAAFSPFGWLGSLCMVDGTVWGVGGKAVVLQHRPEDSRDDG